MAYKVGIIGNGWRTKAFLKVMKELPDVFEFCGMYFRNEEKAEVFDKTYKGLAFTDKEEFFKQGFDFIIVAISRSAAVDACEEAFKLNIPVLCETPPGDGIEDLKRIYDLKLMYNAKAQVLEQYFCQPYHNGILKMVNEGKLGNVSNVDISMIHDYHAISMIRKYLGVGFENCKIYGNDYSFPVTKTCTRDHIIFDGEISEAKHRRAVFEFESGKIAFYNFSGEQYHNYLRTRHLLIQGDRGELVDFDLVWMDENNYPVPSKIVRNDLGHFSNLDGYSNRGLMVDGDFIYQNPYESARLNDDEIAIASIMEGMGKYSKGGGQIYPLEEALQDTYLYLIMDEAVKLGEAINTSSQIWTDIK